MARKKYDLAVKTGEYADPEGNTKGRWKNVGAVMVGDDGNPFIMLERTFNPAGVPNPENREGLLISCFAPRDNQQRQSPPPQRQPSRDHGYSDSGMAVEQAMDSAFDDDLPF